MSDSRNKTTIGDVVQQYLDQGKTDLPVYDRVASQLQEMLQGGEFDIGTVESLIQNDPAYSSALIRLSNSAFFGGLEKIVTVHSAIMRLGVRQVSNLVILSGQKKNFELRNPALRKVSEHLWRHQVGCAVGTQWLVAKLELDDLAPASFLAGLFHDIGKLFLLRVLDDVLADKRYRFTPTMALVMEFLDTRHAEQGYELMKTWALPDLFCDIALNHHHEGFDERDSLLASVRFVDLACNKLGLGLHGQVDIELSTTCEAQCLEIGDLVAAELEIKLEDAMHLATSA